MMRWFVTLPAALVALSVTCNVLAAQSPWLAELEGRSDVPVELIWGLHRKPESLDHQQWAETLINFPQRLGTIDYRNEPLRAGDQQSIQVRYIAGTDLPQGSVVALMLPWQAGTRLQITDPQAESYLTVRGPQGVNLVPRLAAAPVPFASWYEGADMLAFEVTDGQIMSGAVIEFTVSQLQLPGRAGVFYLPVAYQLPGQTIFVSPVRTELTVQAGPTERVELLAPSRLGRNQEADLTLKLTDRFGNPSTSSLPVFDVLVDGNFFGRVEPQSAETLISGISFADAGSHVVEVRTGGGSLRAEANPIVVQSGNKQVTWFDVSPGSGQDADLVVDLQRGALRGGGSRFEIQADLEALSVAVPYIPTDERGIDARKIRLVQVFSGDSQYEWFANRLLGAGYRLGFTAGSFSPIAPVGPTPGAGQTAVTGLGDPVSLLRQGSTYVTTGAQMVLHTTVNGADPGRRVPRNQKREIAGWVQGTGPLDRIELVKNGSVIWAQSLAGAPGSRVLKVSLYSSSAPRLDERDLPRNGREWIGYARSGQTSLTLLGAPGFRNPSRQAIAQNGANRVDFITWTHGGASSFLLQLGDAAEDEVIELNLRDGLEDQIISPTLRAPAEIPAARLMVPMFELATGPVSRFIEVAGYQDEVRFELVDPNAATFSEFRFTDVVPTMAEDYYYIRVIQQDDHVAVTSPVFVGGFDAP
jgi:hypothetical protein